jgi:serine/threonine protein kinase
MNVKNNLNLRANYKDCNVKQIDSLIFEKEIGKGQFGTVYLATDESTLEKKAVKVINFKRLGPEVFTYINSEINIIKKFNHINIARYYDQFEAKNNIYIVMEYCNSGTLLNYLKQKKILTEEEALYFFKQIISGYKYVKENNIVHRDLKLENIMLHKPNGLKPNGLKPERQDERKCNKESIRLQVKIVDFGLAKIIGKETEVMESILGSPIYMAPELINRKRYTSKVDIWSLGIILYELLFGFTPFRSTSTKYLKEVINDKELVFPKKINTSLERLIRQMLDKDHNKRISWDKLFEYFNDDITDTVLFDSTDYEKERCVYSVLYVLYVEVLDLRYPYYDILCLFLLKKIIVIIKHINRKYKKLESQLETVSNMLENMYKTIKQSKRPNSFELLNKFSNLSGSVLLENINLKIHDTDISECLLQAFELYLQNKETMKAKHVKYTECIKNSLYPRN